MLGKLFQQNKIFALQPHSKGEGPSICLKGAQSQVFVMTLIWELSKPGALRKLLRKAVFTWTIKNDKVVLLQIGIFQLKSRSPRCFS